MIEELVLEVKRLAEVEPHALADDETIVALHRVRAQVDAIVARATASWEAGRGYAEEHRSGAAWLAAKTHLPSGEAVQELRRGRALRHLPEVEAAWLAGDVTGRHVSLFADARTDRTTEAMARDESMLVGHATKLTYNGFRKALAYWSQLADPDDDEANAQRLHDDRTAHLSETWRGMRKLDAWFDPVGGAIVGNALRAIEQELFDADWAEARARVGDTATTHDLRRTPAQRRADALVEMATRAMTAPRDGRRPAPLFTVLVDWPTLHGRVCELADGTVVSPGSLVPWLTEADIERAVFRSPTRVEVSERSRVFTGATRRALELRDGECGVEGCDEPAERCQADHILPWALGGPTVQANGRMLCRFHNLLRNRRPQGP